jgi:aminoglycoside phosphotransferase (APT) family kinase protein
MTNVPTGIHGANVSAWLTANVAGAVAPFRFDLIAGGRSNLTFGVTGADGARYVLRRPPTGHLLASAHDMGREYRIISALGTTPVPVPVALGFCDDPTVNDAPFYVMAYVDGLILHNFDEANTLLTAEQRGASATSVVETLAAIHAVDIDEAGLGTLARREDYIARQLRRWYGQWQQSKTRELDLIDRTYEALSARIPSQSAASLVHGDYRIENVMLSPEGSVRAVLDWELCTLGEPLADIGLLSVYWTRRTAGSGGFPSSPTLADGFPTIDDALKHYEVVSGRDLSNIDYFIAFSHWRLACILEGVYARFLQGAMGDQNVEAVADYRDQVDSSAQAAAALIGVA